MKTLVIHPLDNSTLFLSEIYNDKDWDVIDTNVSKKILKEEIKNHDRIIMLGHGTEHGLIGFNHLIIDSTYVYLLRQKECICIWCNANIFVEKYKLKGFYTGMIISECEEALDYCINANQQEINESNQLFSLALKNSIDNVDFLNEVKQFYTNKNNKVINFNSNNLFYKHG